MNLPETPRLTLSHLTPGDTSFLITLMNTPGWLQFIGDRNVHTTEDALRYLQDRIVKGYDENGFGLYRVALKDDNTPIGMCGLVKRDWLDDPDIGFAFLPAHEGRGYALEAARAVMEHAKTTLGLKHLAAVTVAYNERSIRLLEKLGMKREKTIIIPDDPEELLLFGITFL